MNPYQDSSQPIPTRVEDLIARMTVEEKVDQLRSQMLYNYQSPKRDHTVGHIRSLTHFAHKESRKSASECAEINNADLKKSIEANRWGIPVLINEEALHGAQWGDATCFPQSMALAATWDVSLMEQVSAVIARELKAVNIHQVFSPVINIGRDSRWGRTQETYGEDAYLTSRIALAYVKTLEGMNIITTPKHFVDNYGEGGRDSNASNTSWRVLREVFLEPFRVCVEEGGARSIMPAYNSVDGTPCTCSEALLTKILRDEWGFDGFVVSDYGAVSGIAHSHHIAESDSAAMALAIEAGMDIPLPNNTGHDFLELVKTGRISMETLERSVRRVLKAKFQLGLFDSPYVNADEADEIVRCDAHRAIALKAAQKAVVLLKNENNTLPLTQSVKRIGVFGPAHNTVNLGGYSGPYGGWGGDAFTPLQGISDRAPQGAEIKTCANGEDLATVAQSCDVSIYFATIREDEGSDRSNLDLPSILKETKDEIQDAGHAIIVDKREKTAAMGDQEGDILRLAETGIPLIVVLVAGSAVTMEKWQDKASAIVLPWYGGEQGGVAVADVLFGNTNPGGKLPVTFPKSVGQCPIYYCYKPTGRGYAYNDNDGKPSFPFGFGLSYSTFEYGKLCISPDNAPAGTSVTVSLDVTNTSNIAGDEVVQLYFHDSIATISVPVKKLAGFKRVSLEPGETQNVSFELNEQLKLWNASMQRVIEAGEFEIMVGSSSEDIRLKGILKLSTATLR